MVKVDSNLRLVFKSNLAIQIVILKATDEQSEAVDNNDTVGPRGHPESQLFPLSAVYPGG